MVIYQLFLWCIPEKNLFSYTCNTVSSEGDLLLMCIFESIFHAWIITIKAYSVIGGIR